MTYKITQTDVANIFAELVRLSQNKITNYSSDLYHDAIALQRLVTEEHNSIVWAVGNCGTHLSIGSNSRLECPWVQANCALDYSHYRITLTGNRSNPYTVTAL